MSSDLKAILAAVNRYREVSGWPGELQPNNGPATQLMFIDLVQDLVELMKFCSVEPFDSLSVGLEDCNMDDLIRESLFGRKKK